MNWDVNNPALREYDDEKELNVESGECVGPVTADVSVQRHLVGSCRPGGDCCSRTG